MTLSDLFLKIEKFLVECSEDELYMFFGMIDEPKGREMLRHKIAKMIVYRENIASGAEKVRKAMEINEKARKSREEFQVFEKIMRNAL